MQKDADAAMEYFFARLFAGNAQLRAMFPLTLSGLRQRVFTGLSQFVSNLDNQPACEAYLTSQAIRHRKFGVRDSHYETFIGALVATVEHFAGPAWTEQARLAWRGATQYATRVMQVAAALDAAKQPAWWVGEILAHELRSPTIAAVTIRPDQPLRYRPGQFVQVQVARWPRVWRPFSVASVPREDGLINLHVRAVPGGLVSNTLVYHSLVGDTVLLGAAEGAMTPQYAVRSERDVLAIAGGTGLAPIKAIVEYLARTALAARQRKITLFFGARGAVDLYDMADLYSLAADYPQLDVIPVLSDIHADGQPIVPLPEVVDGYDLFDNTEAFVSGPDEMVRQTALMLAKHMPAEQIHHDPLPEPRWRQTALPTGA